MKKAIVIVLGVVLLAAGFTGCNSASAGPVRIATKPMTEQFVTSEILGLLIEKEGYAVEITKGIGGGTSNIQPAMEKGEFDLYTEYTGTGWLNVLAHEEVSGSNEELMQALNNEYNAAYDMSWVGTYGFNNTYTLVVRDEVAQARNLTTMSELAAAAPELVFGGNSDFFERLDGFDALCEAYGYAFGSTVDIDIGLKYDALRAGEIDVTNAYATDAQLSVAPVTVLTDDKNYFTSYYASTVVRNEALKTYPKLRDALMKMDSLLSDTEMAGLSYQVEVEGKDEKEVARAFLAEKGLL